MIPKLRRRSFTPLQTLMAAGIAGALTVSIIGAGIKYADRNDAVFRQGISPEEAATVTFKGVVLEIPGGAVSRYTTITIEARSSAALPDLDPGMHNVTGNAGGFRLGPSGTFNEALRLAMPYDPSKILPGHTADDIHTYYYDAVAQRWVALPRIGVDDDAGLIISSTDHFTDFANATLTLPDYPTPAQFNPNQMSDVELADPTNGINLIEPPRPNNFGTADLQYPIEVPPGRGGMHPSIAVTYNSSAGNGWIGVGWDVPMQAITIDTRWGVPHYDAAKETETYMLRSEELTPVAHRGPLQDRTPEKEFRSRVEGDFDHITRHGDHPANYWWEVIDTEGKHMFYGGDPDSGGPVADSTLAHPDTGHIFSWALRLVRDSNGNNMRYQCTRVVDVGFEGGTVPGDQLYLQEIHYTGQGSSDGPYSVSFIRDRELPDFSSLRRPDVIIDARAGFKVVTADLLKQIEVRFDGALIRRYEFQYQQGAYQKTLLQSVSQYGGDESLFHTHEFEYFDEVSTGTPNVLNGFGTTSAFGDAKTISGNGLLLVGVDSSAFEADVTDSQQTEGSAGISLAGVIGIGGRASTGSGNSIAHLTLVDINGDNLPDQLYQSDGDFFFRPNTGGPTSDPNFGDEVALPTLTEINHEHSQTRTYGGSVMIGVSISGEVSKTTTRGQVYLADVNGDLLPDLVANSQVYYNRLEDGVPTFTPDSPVPLTPGAPSNTEGLVQNPQEDRAEQEQVFHLVDPVRRWVAPYPGTISISGDARLVTAPPMDYRTADGVRASIQLNGAELWSVAITDPSDLTPHAITGLDAVVVSAGDRIYFRVSSLNDGSFDEVEFDPTMTYTDGVDTSQVDENGMPIFVYNAESDFAYGGRPLILNAPVNGSATISGNLVKPEITTDDITLVIRKGPNLAGLTTIHEQTVAWDQTGTFPVDVAVNTAIGEFLQMRVHSDSRIDLSSIRFVPTEIVRGYLPEGGLASDTCADGIDNDGNGVSDSADPTCLEGASLIYTVVNGEPAPQLANGEPTFAFNLPVSMQLYSRNASTTPYVPYVVPDDGSVDVHWSVATTPFTGLLTTTVTLTVKRSGLRLAKQRVQIVNGIIVGPSTLNALIDVAEDDELYFVADSTSSGSISDFFLRVDVMDPELTYTVPPAPATSFPFDLHLGIDDSEAFGGGFRQWSYGQYNGDLGRGEGGGLASTCADGLDNDNNGLTDLDDPLCTLPIDESRLVLPVSEDDPVLNEFLQMIPFVDRDHWRAQDEEAWISGGRMSASRLGVNFLDFPDGSMLGGDRGIVRFGGAKMTSGSLSLFGFGVGGGSGTNWSDIDFLDFNGDRYPDVVGGGEVQPTLPNGGLAADRIVVGGFGRVRESESDTCNINLGATATLPTSDSKGKVKSIKTEKPAYNLSVGVTGGRGDFDTKWDLIDINGDGLPDYLRKTGSGLAVRLNLGYSFAAEEDWDSTNALRRGQNTLKGLSVGVGVTTPSYGLGGGVSHTESRSVLFYNLIDINGDGLVDVVTKELNDNPLANLCIPLELASSSTDLIVRFNTGNHLTAPYILSGAMSKPLQMQVTISRSIGVNGSIGIPIGPVVLSFGGGHSRSRSLGGFEVTLRDFNGDGYVDHLLSNTMGQVFVNLNLHGRTNLLKIIRRPLGAVITLDYQRNGNTIDLPQSRWDLARVEVFDGHPGDGIDTMVHTYSYGGGKYDRTERQFYGYRTVIEEQRDAGNGDALYRSSIRTFLNDNYYVKGLADSETTTDAAGNKFLETLRTYELIDVDTQSVVVPPTSTTATVFPQLVRVDNLFYEGQPAAQKSTYTTHEYDTFGNMITLFDAGDAGPQDDITATVQYSYDLPNHIVSKPSCIEVLDNGVVVRRREADIEPGTGNLLQVRQFLTTGQAAVTDIEYFANANLKRVIGPPNANGQRYTVEFQYDALTDTHITSIIDSFGYQSTSTYDLRYAQADIITDINGHQTDSDFDFFGRLTAMTGPYETGGAVPTFRFEYHHDAAVPWALTRRIDTFRDINDPINGIVFVDGLSRQIQTKEDATIHIGPAAAAEDVMIVFGRVTFDFVGRPVTQRYPTTEPLGTPGLFNPAFDGVPPTTTEYDILDRVIALSLPDGSTVTNTYQFGSDRSGTLQFETLNIDELGNDKSAYRDVRRRITSVRETNDAGAEIIWTSYEYDALDQLIGVEDDQHNVTTLTYDNFGRRVALHTPDTGLNQFVYDLSGNMTARITPNLSATGDQINYSYDFNRLQAINYPNFPENDVTYTHGPPGTPFNRAGRMILATHEGGSRESFYGKQGEVIKEVTTIASDTEGQGPNSPEVYVTEFTFDTWNRLQNMQYPDGELLTYDYDSGGRAISAAGVKNGVTFEYLQRMEYDKFGQRVFIHAMNDVQTTYAYEPLRRRLANLQAGTTSSPRFQDMHYAYDAVGNVLQVHNDVAVPPPSGFGGPVVQDYQYDDLYRLVQANGLHQYAPNKTDRYSLTMVYDTIFNIRQKNQLHERVQPSVQPVEQHKTTYDWTYEYGGSQPHAATHLGERTFTYDPNGNQLGWDDDNSGRQRTIVWDEEDRIQSISDNGNTKTYKYDDAMQRVIKSGPQGETAYVNSFFTVRNRTVQTKHIYVGDLRLASKLTPGKSTPPAGRNPGVPEINFLYFYHPDHLGSSSYITDVDGELYEHIQYFPFGETWVQEKSNTQRTPYLFTANELDEETGLFYANARYFDPVTSLWQSADPLLEDFLTQYQPNKLNPFAYALQNPLRFVDPTGLDADPDPNGKIRKDIINLGKGIKKGDRTKALRLIVDTFLEEPAHLKSITYDPNRTALNTYGSRFKGAKQVVSVGPDFFENFEKRFNARVRNILHEIKHVIQKSQKNPLPKSDKKMGEFLANYAQLTEEIPGIRQLGRALTKQRIEHNSIGSNQYWKDMSVGNKKLHKTKFKFTQELWKWSKLPRSDKTPRPTAP